MAIMVGIELPKQLACRSPWRCRVSWRACLPPRREMPSSSSSSYHRGLPPRRINDHGRAAKQSTRRWMLSRHDAAVRSPLAARGRLRWRLGDVLEYGAVFVMVITCKLSPGDPGTANDVRSQRETSIHNKGDMPERTFAPRQGPAVGSVARARVSLMVPYYPTFPG
jgi:hypothetical protein